MSFDPALKSLVVKAAKRKGVYPVTLLEHLVRANSTRLDTRISRTAPPTWPRYAGRAADNRMTHSWTRLRHGKSLGPRRRCVLTHHFALNQMGGLFDPAPSPLSTPTSADAFPSCPKAMPSSTPPRLSNHCRCSPGTSAISKTYPNLFYSERDHTGSRVIQDHLCTAGRSIVAVTRSLIREKAGRSRDRTARLR